MGNKIKAAIILLSIVAIAIFSIKITQENKRKDEFEKQLNMLAETSSYFWENKKDAQQANGLRQERIK